MQGLQFHAHPLPSRRACSCKAVHKASHMTNGGAWIEDDTRKAGFLRFGSTACVSAGNDDELADWAAFQTATASAWKRGWAKGTLKEWAHELLQKVLFKVGSLQ